MPRRRSELPSGDEAIFMTYNYTALIQGGEGPDVWDKDIEISAVDFLDAAKQAVGKAEELSGHVVMVEQNAQPASVGECGGLPVPLP